MRGFNPQLIQSIARSAPIVLIFISLIALTACEEPTTGDRFLGVSGNVYSATDGTPVENAIVRLVDVDVNASVATDSSGLFVFVLSGKSELKNAVIIVKKSGFIPFDTVLSTYGEGDPELVLKIRPIQN